MTREFSVKPKVDPVAEFLEISNDFTDPKEILREAVSNAYDAGCSVIKINAYIDKSGGTDELVIEIEDDGEGMDEENVECFFGLGFSNRRGRDHLGNKISGAIGEKGHGTKIYFNSRAVEVETVREHQLITARSETPIQALRAGRLPVVSCTSAATDRTNGTKIVVRGYNDNTQAGFSHRAMKDYILWSTKFGSFEGVLGLNDHANTVLHLRGLGCPGSGPERLSFGHVFPDENTNITTLKKSDKVSPLDYYVARWVGKGIPIVGMPNSTLDIVLSLEGDQAKRQYNQTLSELLKKGEDKVLAVKLETLKLFLESADFNKLRSESEPHLVAGRKVKFILRLENGKLQYEMKITGEEWRGR